MLFVALWRLCHECNRASCSNRVDNAVSRIASFCDIISSLKSNPWRFTHMDFLPNSTTQTQSTNNRAKAAWTMFRHICCYASKWLLIFSWLSVPLLALLTMSQYNSCEVNHDIVGTGCILAVLSAVCAIIGRDENLATRLCLAFCTFFFVSLLMCA